MQEKKVKDSSSASKKIRGEKKQPPKFSNETRSSRGSDVSNYYTHSISWWRDYFGE